MFAEGIIDYPGDLLRMPPVQVEDLYRRGVRVAADMSQYTAGLPEATEELEGVHLLNFVRRLQVRRQHGARVPLSAFANQEIHPIGFARIVPLLTGREDGETAIEALRASSAVRVLLGDFPCVRAARRVLEELAATGFGNQPNHLGLCLP
jgi:hypothetical protein